MQVKEHFGEKDYAQLGEVVNKMLAAGELQLMSQTQGPGTEATLVYKIIHSEFKGLDPEDMLGKLKKWGDAANKTVELAED